MKPITDRLDRFDLIAELASGGNATVFLARLADAAFPRLVAIKRLHPHLAREDGLARMFLREAGLAARLEHPNVVPILEVGTSAEGYYLVMEYIEGDTLAHVLARSLRRGHRMPLRVTVRVVLDVLAGLDVIHGLVDDDDRPLGLVHGGVSPRNVLIGVDGVARVADFGVAHAASRANAPRHPPKDELAHLAPEQVRGGPVDARADLFAVGVMLWECVAHRGLFRADTDAEMIEKIAHAPAARLDQLRTDVPAALARACAHALERDPAWRPADAAELADAIARAARAHDLLGTAREVADHLDLVIGADIVRQRDEIRALIARGNASPDFASGSHLVLPTTVDEPPPPRLPPPPRAVSELETTVTSKRAISALRARTATTAISELDAAETRATAPAPIDDAAPAEFGKYVVIGHLADGGMAEVYLARASGIEGFEKIVVIKRLKPELARSETATQLFLQEARIAATLEHPQIAQVYDVGAVDGSYFFAMEHVYGEDLRKVMNAAIRKQRPIALADALRVITELAGALHYAHEKCGPGGEPLGLVHRDVSPSNVLVSHDGAVKLCDFGVAEVTAAPRARQRVLAGKLSYMSPEQCRGDALDRRSDVFVLAVVLYELTTLSKLFKGKGDREVVQQIVSGRIKPPSALRLDYPRELERIVMKGLALDPRDRYQTAQDLRLDLEAFGREEKLALSAVGLSRLMHALFAPDPAAWQAAVRAGHVPGLVAKAGEPPSATATDFDYDAVVELRAPRRWHLAWLAIAAVAAAAAAASVPFQAARDRGRAQLTDDVTAAAGRLGPRLGAHLRAVRARADGIASTPMLRAAIETDAATMRDMIAKEALLTPGDGEVIECFRWRGGRATSLVRVPSGAAALPALRGGEVRVEATADGVRATASARLLPMYEQGGGEVGAVVIAQAIAATALAAELPRGLVRASLRGLGPELVLVRGPDAGGVGAEPLDELAIPIALDADAGRGLPPLVLAAVLPARAMPWMPAARAGAIGVALACALFFLIGHRRHRWWRHRSPGGAL